MSEMAIQTRGLVKRYGKLAAVNGLDLNVPAGAIYGFLGRNGAGKTTTIKTLLGLARATAGTAQVLGHDIRRETVAILQRTAFVSENKMLFDSLTAAELVRFNRGYYPTWSAELAERYVRLFEIPMEVRFGKLSQGGRTKVCLLLALAQGADLLLLDEPTSGLDPVMVDLLLRVLVEDQASQGRTILLSSHHLSEMERICEWVGIIDRGKLLLEARLDDIRKEFRMVTAAGEKKPSASGPEIVSQTATDNFYRYVVAREAEAFAAGLGSQGMTVLEVSPMSLSEVFLALAGKEAACTSGRAGMMPAAV